MYNEVELFGHELIRPATPDQVEVLQRVGNKAHAEAMAANPDIAKAMADFDNIDREVSERDYGEGILDEETSDTQSNYDALLYGMCTPAESEAAGLARATHGIEEYVFTKNGHKVGQRGNAKGSKAAKKILDAKAEEEASYAAMIARRDARDINSARITKIRNEMLKRGEKIVFDRITVVRDDMIIRGQL